MGATARPSSYSYVVDEPLLRTFAAEIQAAIPGARCGCLAPLPDAWLATHSRFEEMGELCWT